MATNTFTSGWVTVRLTCTETVKASSNSSTLSISMECANTGTVIRPGTYNTLFPDGTIKVNGTLLTNGDDGCATKTFNSGAGSHVCDLPDSRDYAPVKSSKQQTQSVWKITVPHEADGTGTARITVNITLVPPSAYYSTETITGTWNLDLTTISAQPSTFTISGNLWLGQTLTANITKAKDTDSNTLFWRLESEGAEYYRPIGSATTNSVIFWDTSAEPDKTTLATAVSNGVVTVRFRLQTTWASTATYSQPVTLAATAPKASTISSVTSGAKIGETVTVTITPSDASYSHELAWRLRTPKTSPYTTITTIAPGASSVSWNTADNAAALTAALADGSVDVVLKLTTTGLPEGVTPNYDSETVTLLEAKSTEASEFVSVSADRSIGQTVTVKFRTNDRSYSHKLEWRGESESTSSYRTIGTQAAQDKDTQSFSWNTSDAANTLYGLCPQTTTAEIVLRLTTVELSKYSYYHMTLSVPADAGPTLVINSIRPEPAFTGTSVVGLYLSGISQVCATVTTTLASGATVEKYTLRVGDKITDLTSTATHPTIYSDTLSTTGADQTVEVTVTDSRGFSTKATLSSVQTINVLEYAPPKLSAVSVYRSNSSGGKDSAGGAYIAARATLTVSPVTVGGIDCNSASGFRVLTKEKGSGSYVSRGAMTSGTRKVFRDSVNGSTVDYSTQSAYEVKIEYTDTVQAALGADPRYLVKLVPSAVIPFHLADDGTGFTGAAIGEAASAGYCSVGAGLTFYPKGPVKGADWTAADTNKNTLLDLFETFADRGNLAATDDLDNFTGNGWRYVNSDDVGTIQHLPGAWAGQLLCFGNGTSRCVQMYFRQSSEVVWIRRMTSAGTWTSWSSYSSVDLSDYVTTSALATALAGYVQTGDLASYVTSSALATTLASYVTSSSLATTLLNYVTIGGLADTLDSYAKKSDLYEFVTVSATFSSTRRTTVTVSGVKPATSLVMAMRKYNGSSNVSQWIIAADVSANDTVQLHLNTNPSSGGTTMNVLLLVKY